MRKRQFNLWCSYSNSCKFLRGVMKFCIKDTIVCNAAFVRKLQFSTSSRDKKILLKKTIKTPHSKSDSSKDEKKSHMLQSTLNDLNESQRIFPCLEQNQERELKFLERNKFKKRGQELVHLTDNNHNCTRSSQDNKHEDCMKINDQTKNSMNGSNESSNLGPEPIYEKIVSGYQIFKCNEPLQLTYGQSLPSFQIAYETWGKLNQDKTNVILLHTGLSASSHAKSHINNPKPGWWEKFIGPGKALDTDKFFIICSNVLGSCYGSTGPMSFIAQSPTPLEEMKNVGVQSQTRLKSFENKDQTQALSVSLQSKKRYGTDFPIVTIFDMVRAQFKLIDFLGVRKLYANVGASMGGMQSLASAALFPHRVGRIITISAAARSHPYSIAMRHVQRQVLMADPNWKNGFYYDDIPPHVGMKLARQIATISYRSGPEWEERFGRKRSKPEELPTLCPDFSIEEYLDHQGEKWCLQYDPNSFLYLSRAMDLFDMSFPIPNLHQHHQKSQPHEHLSPPGHQNQFNLGHHKIYERELLVKGLSPIQMPTLVIGVQSDILFPCWQQKEISDCLKEAGNQNVVYYEVDALYGHDTFLIDSISIGGAIKGHLETLS